MLVNLLLISGAIVLFGIGFVFLVYGLAQRDIFFTLVEPGTAKIVLLNNAFKRTIFNFPGYGMNEKNHDIHHFQKMKPGEREEYEEQVSRFGGLRFVGMPPFWSLYSYKLRWSVIWRNIEGGLKEALEQEGIKGVLVKDKLLQRSEEVRAFYLKATPYGLIMTGVEDLNKIAIDIVILVMASIRNPYKAAFRVNNWWTAVSDNLVAEIRPWVGELSWEDLKGITGNLLDYAKDPTLIEELPDEIRDVLQKSGHLDNVLKLVNLMEDEWGVEILSIRIDEIILPDTIAEAATKKYVAEQEAKAIRAVAAAEKDRIAAVYGGAKEHGPEGVAMKMTEDMAKGGKTVFAVGPLIEAVRGILGKKGGEE